MDKEFENTATCSNCGKPICESNYYKIVWWQGAQAQVDESIEDTIRDVIGYCLLELAYRERNVGEDDRPGGDE